MCLVLVAFVAAAASVDPSLYRTCDQSPFCKRNRIVGAQKWSLVRESWRVVERVFTAEVADKTFDNRLRLKITFLRLGSPRVRLEPLSESFSRYDVSNEGVIVNQSALNDILSLRVMANDTHITIKCDAGTVFISIDKLRIDFVDVKGARVVTLNGKDKAVFETNRPSNFSEPYTFGGHTDYFKHGANGVALDATLYGENIHFSGLPGHTLPLDLPETSKDGDPIRLWTTDIAGYEVGSRLAMYGAVPFLFAHAKGQFTGLLWLNPSDTWVDTTYASANEKSGRFMSETCFIDVFLFSSDKPAEISRMFTDLTGRPHFIPSFVLGMHQSRWGYKTQDEILEVNKKLDEVDAPHDAIWLDLDHTDSNQYFIWNPITFKDPMAMLDVMDKDKRKIVIIVDPHLKAADSYRVYHAAKENGLLLRNKDGGEYNGDCWPGNSAWVDFTMPEARKWWSTLYSFKVFEQSASNLFIWNDMNEISVFESVEKSAPKDVLHVGDHEEREVHNLYGALMVSATFQGLIDREDDKNKRPFILTRSYFAGSQRYTIIWSGDNFGAWDHMRNSLALVMSFGLGGQVFSGCDVGGFTGEPSLTLLTRWYQVGAWCYPFYRIHCWYESPYRELYTLTGTNFEVAREAIYDRYRLMPYWYSLARRGNLTGEPLVRPLWWEFEESDFDYSTVDEKVMVGRSLLVTPFLYEDVTKMHVSLPKSCRWYNYTTEKEVEHELDLECNDGRTPVFVRGGSIIPYRTTIRKSVGEMEKDPISLKICVDDQDHALGEVYMDDGSSFNFLKGDYFYRQFKLSGGVLSSISEGSMRNEVKLGEIRISGLSGRVTSVKRGATAIPFDVVDGVLVIKPHNLLLCDDWSLVIE